MSATVYMLINQQPARSQLISMSPNSKEQITIETSMEPHDLIFTYALHNNFVIFQQLRQSRGGEPTICYHHYKRITGFDKK